MKFSEIIEGVRLTACCFSPCKGGRKELHAVLEPLDTSGGISGQSVRIHSALEHFLLFGNGKGLVPVMARVFLSDVTNQADIVSGVFGDLPSVLSIIGQPPVRQGVKVVLLIIMMEKVEVTRISGGTVEVHRGRYRDIWSIMSGCPGKDSGETTEQMFESLESLLSSKGMSVADNCLRTWFFVRDIDNRYSGMVTARNDYFKKIGLDSTTHFIASTGIEGATGVPEAVVSLDALSVGGVLPGQVKYISAPDFLNPTIDYGVAFERATAVEYGDRSQVIVSGTASIDKFGEIVAPGNISEQCQRMADNVEALLESAGASASDMTHIIVYLRDSADSDEVGRILSDRFPGVPTVAVRAAVCRPGWLVEMECMAITPANNPDYEAY